MLLGLQSYSMQPKPRPARSVIKARKEFGTRTAVSAGLRNVAACLSPWENSSVHTLGEGVQAVYQGGAGIPSTEPTQLL